uniref:Anaphase-promoting complex subunit 4 WD40 domain-containing protein n=1 Tax=Ascaris lumbricoides TaxID=6252 RepID=A0A9J2PQJ5_ASCLU
LIYRLTDKELGEGPVTLEWRPGGTYIAVSGSNKHVKVFDRNGALLEEIIQPGLVTSMTWDKDGDVLALTNDKTTAVTLWEVGTKKTETLDANMGSKESPTFALWSRKSPILAVGNSKGNLMIYNHRTSRKVPVLGKHQRAITCGAFSDGDLLALGADDASITVSNMEGDSIYSFTCNSDPSLIKFNDLRRPADKTAKTDTMLSAVLGKKILMLVSLSDSENPINLQFQARYGDITSYVWFSDGYLLLGFDKGFVVCISAHASEIGQVTIKTRNAIKRKFPTSIIAAIILIQEIFSVQDFKTYLSYVHVNETFEKALMVGDNQLIPVECCRLKIRELNQLSELFGMYDIEGEDKGKLLGLAEISVLSRVETSTDGQLVAVAGTSGTLHVFLTKMPVLGSTYHDIIAILSSPTEVTVLRESEKTPLATFPVKLEPSVIAVGPLHVAISMNNRAWFYELHRDGSAEMVCEFEYMSTVNAMQINYEYAVAKLDGRAQLHKMRNRQGAYDSEESGIMFPDSEHNNARLQDIGLTDNFFIYCTDGGHLHYFSLEDGSYVNEYRHIAGIRMIFPEPDGIRLCFFDERLDAYIYSPVDDALSKVPDIESTAHFTSCLWENFTVDRDTFVICDTTTLHVFLFSKNQIDGQSLMKIGMTQIPYGHKPLMLCKGIVHCQTQSGRTGTVLLESHKTDMVLDGKSAAALQKLLDQALTLKRWLNAWRICDFTKSKEHWRKYAFAAMQNADVELAIRVLKQIDDVALVWALEEVQFIEERNLLAGHLALIMEQYDIAEGHFLRSTRPIEALDMRRDLLHWEKALQLANRLAPQEIPYISKEYAQQLEFIGEYSAALTHYENGIIDNYETESEEILDHNEICRSGIARMSIRAGDIRRLSLTTFNLLSLANRIEHPESSEWGIKMASELDGRAVKKDCALILEQMKQYGDAALLYELGHFYDRAAAVCLKAKNWTKVGDLLPKVRSPKIHAQYGKVMEGEKKYKQAALAYKNARDYDNVVRILLDYLDMPEEAVRVVKESRSVEGAKLVAK